MSVVRATSDDLKDIYELHKTIYQGVDSGYIEHFYRHLFNPLDMYLIKKDAKIISMANVSSHTFMLNNQLVKGSIISNVMTSIENRNQGCLDEIMKMVITNCEHSELVTFVRANKIFEKYGFKTMYYRREYTLTKDKFNKFVEARVNQIVSYDDLYDIYARFSRRFNGYLVRDENYFKSYNKAIRKQNGQIVTVYNKESEIEGYACLIQEDDKIIVDEIIYLNVDVLYKIISLVFELRDKVVIKTTPAERLDLLFPAITYRDYPFMMARINDYELYNHIFETGSTTLETALNSIGKPMFMNERC